MSRMNGGVGDVKHVTVVGLVPDRAAASRAVNELRAAGFRDDQLGVVGKNTSGLADDPTGSKWEEGSGIGAAAGATTGIGLGLAVAVGLIPAVGPVLAGGTLMALLASAGAGAAAGTLVGALVGLGVPDEDAKRYEGELAAGRVLVTVRHADERAPEALAVVQRHGVPPTPADPVGAYTTRPATASY